MNLKDMLMRCTFDGVSKELEKVYHQFKSEYSKEENHENQLLFNHLREMEAEPCDIILRVVDGDVSGFYNEETLAEMQKVDPEVWQGAYGLGSLPLQLWLGAEVESELSTEAVIANFLYELGWHGSDAASILKHMSRIKYVEEIKCYSYVCDEEDE